MTRSVISTTVMPNGVGVSLSRVVREAATRWVPRGCCDWRRSHATHTGPVRGPS